MAGPPPPVRKVTGPMRIDVFSDPVCPWCYIGKRRLERATRERPGLGFEIHWRSFQLNPEMPPAGIARCDYLSLKFGGAERARKLYDQIARVGTSEGIDFAFERIERTPNTVDAHRLIRFAAGTAKCDDVVERLFRAYFQEGRSIGDIESLAVLAGEAGLDAGAARRHLETDEGVEAVRLEDMQARQLGIQGVPCFIIDDQYALSGAQEPEAFFPIFDLVGEESAARAGRGT